MDLFKKLESYQELPYDRKLRLRQRYLLIQAGVGLVFILLSCFWEGGIYSAMGGGLLGGSLAVYFRLRKLSKDAQKMEELELQEQDERNRFLSRMCWAYSGYLLYLLLFLGMAVFAFINKTVALTLAAVILVYLGLMIFIRFGLNKRY